MQFRPYDPDRDREAAHRIWREIGWIEPGKEELMDICLEASRTWVADLDGSAECAVLSARGDLRYLDGTLSFAGLTGVSTSRVARRQGLARRLIDACIAAGRDRGATRLYLETNASLTPAIALYHSVGFVDLPAQPTPYARCNVWMELKL